MAHTPKPTLTIHPCAKHVAFWLFHVDLTGAPLKTPAMKSEDLLKTLKGYG